MSRKLFIVVQVALLAIAAVVASAFAGGVGAAPGAGSSQNLSRPQPADPVIHQDFQDVPQSNPFFNNLRNLYRAGIVSGYNCGGPNEPCVPPENLPYYRPGGYVSRLQMSKFVDLARRQPGIAIDTAANLPIYARTSAANGRAIEGDATAGNGLHGLSSSTTASGVYGENVASGFGVAGRSNGGGTAVFGDNSNGSGYAGYFNGNVRVVGTLAKGGGSFEIDHPLDPANKYLYHSFVESPDMMNIYNGNATLDANGEAWVQMPDWFEALNKDFRYQLTAIGAPGPNLYVAEKIQGNRFKIAGGKAGMEVSWQVTGVRHDPYAEQYRIPVEKAKSPSEQGKYLYPELYGQPDSQRVVTGPEGK
jgi:hypothetical protein